MVTRRVRLAAACTAALAAFSSATSIPATEHADIGPSETAAKQNAFDIFNAIHSAMRQWGSSLNHNGMSFFLATIPAGVTLHHGTHSPNPPTGPEWLAFEIEHAENFAHPRRRPGSGPLPPPPGGAPPGGPPPGEAPPGSPPQFTDQHPFHIVEDHPHPLPPPDHHRDHHLKPPPSPHPSSFSSSDHDSHGYLHTYLTTTPLHLLYLDGTSAGNTDMGTLDTQDFILRLNRSAPIWDERGRARELCDIVTSWGLHGVVRMEAGFEVIKCDFGVGMRLISANRRQGVRGGDGPGGGAGGGGGGVEGGVRMFEFVRAVAGRYHGIGGGRVQVDWGSMVSAFFYEVDLGNPDTDGKKGMPRLVGGGDGELRAIRGRVEEVVKERREGGKTAVDWQGVVDLVVARYADRLRYMADGNVTIGVIRAEVNGLLDTHIDYSAEDKGYDAAMGRCTRFYTLGIVPVTQEDHLIKAAIETVTHNICATLFEVRKLVVEDTDAGNDSLELARGSLKVLMDKLRWTRWKECAACAFDEVCFIPMWPFGDKASYDRPSCRKVTSVSDGWWENGYWQPGWGKGHHKAKITDEGPRDL